MQPSNSAHSARCVRGSAQPPLADVRALLPVTVHVRASDDRQEWIRDTGKGGGAGILLLRGSTSGFTVESNPDYSIHTRTLCIFKM